VELIRDWMTIPFVARMYHVHLPAIFAAIHIPHEGNEEKSIKQLNEEYYPDMPGLVLNMVKAAVQAHLPPPATANPPATPVSPVSP
jgi:hypothetical protein